MTGNYRFTLPVDSFLYIIATLLLTYDEEHEFFIKCSEGGPVMEDSKKMLKIIGRAVELFIGDLHENKVFMDSLEEFCKVYAFDINTIELISDILGKRYQEEHQEIN